MWQYHAQLPNHDHRTETALRAVAWLRHAETHGEGVYVLQALAAEARTADCHNWSLRLAAN